MTVPAEGVGLTAADLYRFLGGSRCPLFVGVPDTILAGLGAYLVRNCAPQRHVVAANEGNAVALAAGAQLARGGCPVVYLQNSGLGNALNPLVSLADPQVSGIPMLLIVGWRGQPGVPDEPQHRTQGAATLGILDSAGIPHLRLSGYRDVAGRQLAGARELAEGRSGPVVVLVPASTLARSGPIRSPATGYRLSRHEAIAAVLAAVDPDCLLVASTGMIARELFGLRRSLGQSSQRDFHVVGAMGHASQVALGVALGKPARTVVCLDGDGAALMHLGGMATIGATKQGNFVHVILNNGAHDSVGGVPTAGFAVDFPAIARACGYRRAQCVTSAAGLVREAVCADPDGPVLLEVRVARGSTPAVGRPDGLGEIRAQFSAEARRGGTQVVPS